MNGRSSKAAGVTKFRLKRVESDTNGRMLNARYGVDGLRTKKQDANGNSSREYGVGISTSASTPLTQNSTAPSISYISGPVILGAEIDGEFVYHLGDALSTVRDVVDDEGDVLRSFEFDEYGNLLNSSGSGAASPKTWIGGLSVNDDRADSGLWNMGHRNYAGGVLGRFISRDPIGFAGGLNLYSYSTNPVRFVDPAGLEDVIIYLPQQDVNDLNRILETWISREQIRQDIESRLRDFLDCDQINVKLKDYHLDFDDGNPSEKRPFANLHLSSADLWQKDERGWFSPGGHSNPRRARVSGPALRRERDSRVMSAEAISNVARNVIIHETIGHALGKIGNSHSTGLWGPRIDFKTFSKSVLYFDKDFSVRENDLLRRKLRMNIKCSH